MFIARVSGYPHFTTHFYRTSLLFIYFVVSLAGVSKFNRDLFPF